jgi:predicted lysophospholipase L1 biosynthesis ABC-type transport system permease subunit
MLTFVLAARLLWREFLRNQWTIISLALILAVTAITGFYFYTERLQRALDEQSASLLGGNIVITSPNPIYNQWKEKLGTMNLHYAEVWLFPSVVKTQNQFHLVNIQAVSNNYPLFGKHLNIMPGSVMIDIRLVPLLSLKQNGSLAIGAKNFYVQNTLPLDIDVLNVGWMIFLPHKPLCLEVA